MKNDKTFLAAADVMKILQVGKTKAYEVIKQLNDELEAKGYLVISGKISRKYFEKRLCAGV